MMTRLKEEKLAEVLKKEKQAGRRVPSLRFLGIFLEDVAYYMARRQVIGSDQE